MVVQDFPAAKLLVLLLRQISKPISDSIKQHAKQHSLFRSYICMPPAYIHNWCEVKTKMWLMNLGKPTKLPPLSESVAIDLGSQILGEAAIFMMAAFLVCVEYSRQIRIEEKKEEMNKKEVAKLTDKIQILSVKVEEQVLKIQQLHYTIYKLTGHVPDGIHIPVQVDINKSDINSEDFFLKTSSSTEGEVNEKRIDQPDSVQYESCTKEFYKDDENDYSTFFSLF